MRSGDVLVWDVSAVDYVLDKRVDSCFELLVPGHPRFAYTG